MLFLFFQKRRQQQQPSLISPSGVGYMDQISRNVLS